MHEETKAIVRILSCSVCILLGICLAAGLTGCNKQVGAYSGRLYYTLNDGGCTRIEWTDPEGRSSHHVLGAVPLRNELADNKSNADKNEALASQSKFVYAPCVSSDGKYMVCLYGKKAAVCLYNLEAERQEGVLKPAGRINSVCWGRDNHEIIYSCLKEDNYCHLYLQRYPQAPVELLKARRIEGAVINQTGNKIYYADIAPDGYTQLKCCDMDGGNISTVLQGASQPSFPLIGHDLICMIEGKLFFYDLFAQKASVVNEEPGIVSPCWNPQSNALAFVRHGVIYTLKPGDEPVQVMLKNKNVTDVCWAR